MRLVLASQSPSRRMLLENAGVRPVIHPAHIDEDALLAASTAGPADTVTALARAKAAAVASQYPGDVVIGCDSMLLLDGQLQGKPHSIEATVARWRAQRGKTAQLITGHAVHYQGQWVTESVATTIAFGQVSDADIEAYARSGEPLECAGAFTLEALGSWFIDSIEGDPSSVIGLSMPLLRRALYSFGLSASQFWAGK
ncbi:Maf-like protein [Corynebacterium sanguinis]|uniref:Maf family protein n=1 Tax=Corynebacterium sanguinis TaxID=2594913 RepID=UPI0010AB374A|nr:nucleoside triphosphate pyrophosphatase [Corynebacterium sanguinis]MCT1425521.1 Maf-like protein [Corynebacterium sanguinis]MCT1664646.1 Maf-like protein [Corynebacterium sanguinis]